MEEKVEEEITLKQEKEKIALVEVSPYQVKLCLAWKLEDAFEVFDEFCEPLLLHEDIERDGFIKPTQILQCREILKMFRKFCDSQGITKSIAYATFDVRAAKNHFAFLEEMEMASGFKFRLLAEEEEIQLLHFATLNSLDTPKGVLFSVEQEQTRIIAFSRKQIIGKQIIPFGYENLMKLFIQDGGDFVSSFNVIKDFFAKQIEENSWFSEEDMPDVRFIGTGDIFDVIGKVSMRGRKYNLDMLHNYPMTSKDYENVLNAVVPLKLAKDARLKGISKQSLGSIIAGVSLVAALFESFEVPEFSISTTRISDGMLMKQCVGVTVEKPIQDLLGYSLEINQKLHQPYQTNGRHVFELAMLLFRQLRVMHKLSSRFYVRALKIACYMNNCGAMIRFSKSKKDCLNVVLHSQIYGASHRDLILAAFITQAQHSEDFSLSDWVKFKDVVNDQDLVAVKYLAIMVRLAACFDKTGTESISDVICDVLGDSVIVKTITHQDTSFELRLANQVASDFKQVFSKNLELL